MIDFPVTAGVLLGAVLGFLIGACCSYMRRKNLRETEAAAKLEEIGTYCPRCGHSGMMQIVEILRRCKECNFITAEIIRKTP